MSDIQLKAGDVVRLNSDGPWMTASHTILRGSQDVWICLWFDENKALQWGEFHPMSLTKHPPKPKEGK